MCHDTSSSLSEGNMILEDMICQKATRYNRIITENLSGRRREEGGEGREVDGVTAVSVKTPWLGMKQEGKVRG